MNASLQKPTFFFGLLVLLLLTAVGSCGKATPPATLPEPNAIVDTTTSGQIHGIVAFDGTAPVAPTRQTKDAACGAVESADIAPWIVASDKGLKNCFVFLSSGLDGKRYAPPIDTLRLDQQGCEYHPRVFGIMTGQYLRIENDDATLHNVHAGGENPTSSFNLAQMSGAEPIVTSFSKSENLIPFRCDVHPWMAAYGGVLDHPFFATTDSTGSYEISGIPPGTYTLEVWHEPSNPRGAEPGKRETRTVTVGVKQVQEQNFTLTAK